MLFPWLAQPMPSQMGFSLLCHETPKLFPPPGLPLEMTRFSAMAAGACHPSAPAASPFAAATGAIVRGNNPSSSSPSRRAASRSPSLPCPLGARKVPGYKEHSR